MKSPTLTCFVTKPSALRLQLGARICTNDDRLVRGGLARFVCLVGPPVDTGAPRCCHATHSTTTLQLGSSTRSRCWTTLSWMPTCATLGVFPSWAPYSAALRDTQSSTFESARRATVPSGCRSTTTVCSRAAAPGGSRAHRRRRRQMTCALVWSRHCRTARSRLFRR